MLPYSAIPFLLESKNYYNSCFAHQAISDDESNKKKIQLVVLYSHRNVVVIILKLMALPGSSIQIRKHKYRVFSTINNLILFQYDIYYTEYRKWKL